MSICCLKFNKFRKRSPFASCDIASILNYLSNARGQKGHCLISKSSGPNYSWQIDMLGFSMLSVNSFLSSIPSGRQLEAACLGDKLQY